MKYSIFAWGVALSATIAAPTVGHAAASVTYVGVAYGSSNNWSGPVQVKTPAGTQNGDLMLAYIATQTTNGAWLTAPSGWTQVTKTFNAIQGAQLFWRIAHNEPASYSWSGASYGAAIIKAYRNVDATAPIGRTAGCGSDYATSCQIPAFAETAVAGERYVGFWDFNLVSAPISGPGDLGNVSRDLTQRSMFTGDKLLSASGNTNVAAQTAKVSGAPNYWDAIGVTIKPAATNVASSPPVTQPPPPSSPPASMPSSGSGVVAVSANDFLNSLGICIASPANGSPNATYAPLIKYIGVRNVSGGSLEGGGSAANSIELAQLTNTKILWALDSGFSGSSVASNISAAKALATAGALLAVAGANEPDNWTLNYQGQVGGGSYSWLPVAKLQADLYAAVKADSVLKNYPVFHISHNGAETDNVGLQFLTIPNGSGLSMPDGTKYADYANMHNYVIWEGAPTPVDNIAWNVAAPTGKVAPAQNPLVDDYGTTWKHHYAGSNDAQLQTLPRVTTETGWVSSNGGEDNQAKVLLNVYLSQYKRGYKYTFLYQLRDNEGGFNNTFGIVRPDYSYKPAAVYIHNLTTILNDNKAVGIAPGSLNYSIASEPATVHDLLMQKSTGAFELVVWDERPVGEATDKVNVNLGGTHGTVNLYDPTVGVTATQTLSNVSSVPLTLSDHPIIIEVVN
ncbi:conserved exported protein of unknown function [Methylocella tundrae]|uniref:Uncharacterized protein n=2 Tax=Methylocella tundrae TaxID=227605 RepID=A0A4V6IMP9_METTU|nr:conserved exported protein of unknown function [Methylocella tundrae]